MKKKNETHKNDNPQDMRFSTIPTGRTSGPETLSGSLVAAVVIAAIFLALALTATNTWPPFLKFLEGSAAAWVQAIGSIAAIVAATRIAMQQTVHSKQLENDKRLADEIRRLEIIKALMVRSVVVTEEVLRAVDTLHADNLNQVATKLMRETQGTLASLPVFEIPAGLLALDVLQVGPALECLADLWDAFEEKSHGIGTFDLEAAAKVEACAQELLEVCKGALEDANDEIKLRKALISSPLPDAKAHPAMDRTNRNFP